MRLPYRPRLACFLNTPHWHCIYQQRTRRQLNSDAALCAARVLLHERQRERQLGSAYRRNMAWWCKSQVVCRRKAASDFLFSAIHKRRDTCAAAPPFRAALLTGKQATVARTKRSLRPAVTQEENDSHHGSARCPCASCCSAFGVASPVRRGVQHDQQLRRLPVRSADVKRAERKERESGRRRKTRRRKTR